MLLFDTPSSILDAIDSDASGEINSVVYFIIAAIILLYVIVGLNNKIKYGSIDGNEDTKPLIIQNSELTADITKNYNQYFILNSNDQFYINKFYDCNFNFIITGQDLYDKITVNESITRFGGPFYDQKTKERKVFVILDHTLTKLNIQFTKIGEIKSVKSEDSYTIAYNRTQEVEYKFVR
jgi:hypothetical protein